VPVPVLLLVSVFTELEALGQLCPVRTIPTRSGWRNGGHGQSVDVRPPKKYVPEPTEKMSLERFCKEIRQHDQSGAMAYGNALRSDTIRNPKIADVHVARLGAR
jgi:hypothetical protein